MTIQMPFECTDTGRTAPVNRDVTIGQQSGLLPWHVSDIARMTLVSDRCSSWSDRSPAGLAMTQTDEAKRPLLASAGSAINGRRPLYFNPTRGDNMRWPGTLPSGTTSAGKMSWVFPIKMPLHTGSGTAHILSTSTSVTNRFIIYATRNTANFAALCGTNAGRALASTPYAVDTWFLAMVDWDPTTGRLSVSADGGRTWVSDTKLGKFADANPVSLGGGYSSATAVVAGTATEMSLGEVLPFNLCLRDSANAAILAEVQDYAEKRYDL